jgi:hypothetical protein
MATNSPPSKTPRPWYRLPATEKTTVKITVSVTEVHKIRVAARMMAVNPTPLAGALVSSGAISDESGFMGGDISELINTLNLIAALSEESTFPTTANSLR